MKSILIGLLFFNISASAQRPTFLRIYNPEKSKIAKGHFKEITDSTVSLENNKSIKTIHLKNIGYIRTRRSGGHKVVIGSVVGAVTVATVAYASTPSEETNDWLFNTRGEYVASMAIVGATFGVIGGVIATLISKPQTFVISRDPEEWKRFQKFISLNNDQYQFKFRSVTTPTDKKRTPTDKNKGHAKAQP